MKTILIMSLTGSMMVIAVRLLNSFIKRQFLAGWQSVLLKAAVFFFLIPPQFIRTFYQGLQHLLFSGSGRKTENIIITRNRAAMLLYDTKVVINTPGNIYAAITALWSAAVFFFLIKYFCQYKKYRKLISHGLPTAADGELFTLLSGLKKELKLKSGIGLYIEPQGRNAFTMGIFSPIIVLPADMGRDKLRLLLLHELTHIKNKDLLIKGAALLILCIHWFNPFAYLLFKMVNESNEICCDNKVARRLSGKECKKYCELIIEMAAGKPDNSLFVSSIKGGNKVMKNRLSFIMNGKKAARPMKCLTFFISVFLISGCSLTAFAYGKPIEVMRMDGPEGFVEEEFKDFSQSDIAFVKAGDSLPFEQNEKILYAEQFVDKNGNIYETGTAAAANCAHAATTDGTYQKHAEHNDGGCIIINYSAGRCPECGTVFTGNLISEADYPKCIH